MPEHSPQVRVHVNIEVSAAALQSVVTISKQKNEIGARMDTADLLSALISRFLRETDFDAFARNPENYP